MSAHINSGLAEELFGSFGTHSYAPLSPADETDAARADDIDKCWRAGELSWKLEPHQLEVYELFHEWNARRLTAEYEEAVEASEATLDDVWVEEIGRRFGKTSKWIIMLAELCVRRPGAMFTYATALQKDIGEIVRPLADMLLSDGPDDVRPEYHGSQMALHEGLYFPNGSVIKLVGIDKHPDALRGRFSDGVVISEAAHTKKLENTVRAVLLPQFQRRPWAFLALESSTNKQPGHDFARVFRPDAIARGAYVMRTIDDNKAISEREKLKAIRQSGGRGHPVCECEYFCVETRDPDIIVIPEFDEKQHVRELERPEHAICLTAADPGSQDLFGLVFGYADFENARGVIERSWARRNPSTRQVAAVVALHEFELWRKQPDAKLKTIPLERTDGIDGWRELLAGEADRERCEELRDLANSTDRQPMRWHGRGPDGSGYCYWDGERFAQNPKQRTTDVDVRFVNDLTRDYGITFSATRKDHADAQRHAVRNAIASGKLVFLPGAGPVILHVKNAVWNAQRTDLDRSDIYGHYDCLAALIYWWRNLPLEKNPNAPIAYSVDRDNTFVSLRNHEPQTPEQLVAAALLTRTKNLNGWRSRKDQRNRWRS